MQQTFDPDQVGFTCSAILSIPTIHVPHTIRTGLEQLSAKYIRNLKKAYGLPKESKFVGGLFSKSFGFHDAIVCTERTKTHSIYSLNPKPVCRITTEDCPECENLGYMKGNCHECHGSGKKLRYNKTNGAELAASTKAFLDQLANGYENWRIENPSLRITLSCEKNKYLLSGKFQSELVEHFERYPDRHELKYTRHIMSWMYRRLWQPYSEEHWAAQWVQAHMNYGHPVLTTAGNNNVSPKRPVQRHDEPVEFSGHNIEDPVHQIVLFTGLVALCDELQDQQ